jgi:CRP-like cAMP-binding protein
MYLTSPPSDTIAPLLERIPDLTQALLEDFDLGTERTTLEGVENLYELFDPDRVFLIEDGALQLCHNGHTLVSFDEGDLVGITHSFHMPTPIFRADEYVELIVIDRNALLRHIYSDQRRMHYWSQYLISLNSALLNHMAEQHKSHARPAAGFQNVQPGEVIIQQGDVADHVYTIISGHADVFVDNVKVGDIGEEEVFGAMAAFTGEARSATVVATTPCTIMAVPRKDFVLLIEAQPQAALNLIEGFARRISTMNQQLIEESEKQDQK